MRLDLKTLYDIENAASTDSYRYQHVHILPMSRRHEITLGMVPCIHAECILSLYVSGQYCQDNVGWAWHV